MQRLRGERNTCINQWTIPQEPIFPDTKIFRESSTHIVHDLFKQKYRYLIGDFLKALNAIVHYTCLQKKSYLVTSHSNCLTTSGRLAIPM